MKGLLGVHVLSTRDRFPTQEAHVSSALRKDSLSDTDYSFKQSINAPKPRACTFGVKPQTLVLMADLTWRPASRLRPGNRVVGFDEKPGPSRYRGYRVATVVALTIRRARTLTLGTEFGEVTCTTDHRWLERNRFRSTATIRELRLATIPVLPPAFGAGYKMGYLHGALAGDGNFSHGPAQTRATLRVCDEEFAARFAQYGQDLGFEGFRTFAYIAGYTKRPLYGVRTSRIREASSLSPYSEPSPTAEYMRGWLAGAFDAEGSSSGGQMLRIHQRISNRPFWKTAQHFLETLDVPYAVETQRLCPNHRRERMGSLRIRRVANQLKFVALTQPALERKWAHLRQGRLKSAALAAPVLSRRDAGVQTVVVVQTSNGTVVEGGFLSHNRPLV